MQRQRKLEKIYSRPRFKLSFLSDTPKVHKSKKKLKFTFPIFSIWIIAILFCISVWNVIKPVFETLCEDKAKAIATKITNEETTNIMNKYSYDSFFTIEKDINGNLKMITANVLKINQVTSDIAMNIQKALEKNEKNKIFISSGALTGIKYLSGLGPRIGMNIACSGNIETNVRSEFIAQGVNQTVHRIYLDIKTNINILTSFDTIEKSIENQVLILENVIIGEIPSTYYNFEGTSTEQEALRLIE